MKTCQFLFIATLVLSAGPAGAVTIDEPTDSFLAGIGDFAEVSGFDAASSPGQVVEVLGGPGAGTATDFATGRTSDMGMLWQALDNAGVSTATTLGFGFGINQTGAIGTNFVDVLALSMSFELPDATTVTFDLGNDAPVTVWNYNQGQNTAEAIFFVSLGFDFMTTYSAASLEDFTVSATLGHTDDGFEIMFFGSAFASGPPVPMPEPTVPMILGIGLLVMLTVRRRLVVGRQAAQPLPPRR